MEKDRSEALRAEASWQLQGMVPGEELGREALRPLAAPLERRDRGEDEAEGDRLLHYALEELEGLFLDQFGQPHVLVRGQALALPRGASQWLRELFFRREGRALSQASVRSAAATLEALACYQHGHARRELHVRSAWHEDALYVELDLGRVVRISAEGWCLDPEPPVLFRRYPCTQPLPLPEEGGSLEDLLELFPTRVEEDRRLLLAYVVTGWLPHVARPILLLFGPQGSRKTTTQRLIKRLLDPTKPEMIRLDPRDLLQKAMHRQVVLIDNVSELPNWAADVLCRLVTGEGDAKRRLYTDDEEVLYELQRLVLLNGINPPTDRPDFQDRCLILELERPPETERREEEEIWALFREEHPRWLGALFDLLGKAIALRPGVKPGRLPRLADWGRWAAAVYEAMGWGVGRFVRDWEAAVARQHRAVVEGDPVAEALLAFMEGKQGRWSGSVSELLEELAPVAESLHLTGDRSWPRSAKALGRRLRGLQPVLAHHGIRLRFLRTASARLVELERAGSFMT